MKIQIPSYDVEIKITKDKPTFFYIQNLKVLEKFISLLIFEEGQYAEEAYFLYTSEGKELKAKNAFSFISNPFAPYEFNTQVQNKLYKKIENELMCDIELTDQFEKLAFAMDDKLFELTNFMQGRYEFHIEWNISKLLKAYKFAPIELDRFSILEKQIVMLELLCDIDQRKPVIYLNLSKILDHNDLKIVLEKAIFLQIPMLLFEYGSFCNQFCNERVYVIDQDLCFFSI